MNNAFVTFADNDIYLKSAYALALSLVEVQSKYPLCVMIPEEIDITDFESSIQNLPVIIHKVPYLFFDFLQKYWQNVTINKFHCFALTQFDIICFLDADSYLQNNIDYVFDCATPAIGCYTNDKNELCVSTGIFVVKPSLSFYSLLINLCITLSFYDDENVFYYLSQQQNILKFNTYLNQAFPELYENDLLQEQGTREKYFARYSYKEIENKSTRLGLKNYIDFYKKK